MSVNVVLNTKEGRFIVANLPYESRNLDAHTTNIHVINDQCVIGLTKRTYLSQQFIEQNRSLFDAHSHEVTPSWLMNTIIIPFYMKHKKDDKSFELDFVAFIVTNDRIYHLTSFCSLIELNQFASHDYYEELLHPYLPMLKTTHPLDVIANVQKIYKETLKDCTGNYIVYDMTTKSYHVYQKGAYHVYRT